MSDSIPWPDKTWERRVYLAHTLEVLRHALAAYLDGPLRPDPVAEQILRSSIAEIEDDLAALDEGV